MTSGKVKCDGNHGGPRCCDPECWSNVVDASWPDDAVDSGYQLMGGEAGVARITDKPDTKNVRGDWFNAFGGEDNAQSLRNFQASLDARGRQAFELAQEVNKLVDTLRDRDTEVRVLRQACKAAGDEIRELHAQRKPEQRGAYWLTFPECATSRGMYWAMAGLLGAGGLLLAWCFA